MAKRKHAAPDFFEDNALDPVNSATGQTYAGRPACHNSSIEEKKKVGFYIKAGLWERFNRTFHELMLEGSAPGNKSGLLEAALTFALDDIDKGAASKVRKLMRG